MTVHGDTPQPEPAATNCLAPLLGRGRQCITALRQFRCGWDTGQNYSEVSDFEWNCGTAIG